MRGGCLPEFVYICIWFFPWLFSGVWFFGIRAKRAQEGNKLKEFSRTEKGKKFLRREKCL